MNIKKLKRRCMVRGCKSVDTYAISQTREAGNSVIVCKSCLESALKEMADYKEPEKPKRTEPKGLFFDISKREPVVLEESSEPIGVKLPKLSDLNGYVCTDCGRAFEKPRGLEMHKRFCKGVADNET
ncbi:MAG: hypothetical protein M0R40_00615 [Firmicutes bacterium]|nr:hypothetical protein [Bacillota bacterium]